MTSERPRLLDLFCGAGGATAGYQRAGFHVTGVDIKPQPHYCGNEFYEAHALDFMLWNKGQDWDVIHASPPCQRHSMYARNLGTAETFPELIAPTRAALEDAGKPFVIENVEGAPLIAPIMLCGASFGLGTAELSLRRHRLFECTFEPGMIPPCSCGQKLSVGVYGNGSPQWHREKLGRNVLAAEWREAMGIDWMTKAELAQAIPPAYTEHLGACLMRELRVLNAR